MALRLAAQEPDRVVVTQGGQTLTRATLVGLACRLGGALDARGLRRGAVIAFQLPNWWEACVINMAAALFGYRIVPLLPIYRGAELGAILPACGAEAVFVPPADDRVDYQALVQSLPLIVPQTYIVRGEGPDSFGSLLRHPPATPDTADFDDAKMIMFTSGSTGRPKGVIHSHASLDAVVRNAAEFWGIGAGDTLYVPSPISHIGGSIYAFEFPWISGCQVILEDHWDPDLALRRIEGCGVTFMAGATPFLQGLVAGADRTGGDYSGLRRFVCGGASVPPELVREGLRVFPNAVVSRAYGATEVPLAFPGIRSRNSAMGRAETDGEAALSVRILDDHGNDLPAGAEGEIVLKGPQQFLAYLDAADEEGAFTPDGGFRMGDLGRLIDGRFITITGRKKDIIIRKGENISPVEIENALLTHVDVRAVAIVGAPDVERGEMVVAYVVVAEGAEFDLAAMSDHLTQAGFARQKFPERLELIEALPMNAVGKVQKPILREWAATGVGRASVG